MSQISGKTRKKNEGASSSKSAKSQDVEQDQLVEANDGDLLEMERFLEKSRKRNSESVQNEINNEDEQGIRPPADWERAYEHGPHAAPPIYTDCVQWNRNFRNKAYQNYEFPFPMVEMDASRYTRLDSGRAPGQWLFESVRRKKYAADTGDNAYEECVRIDNLYYDRLPSGTIHRYDTSHSLRTPDGRGRVRRYRVEEGWSIGECSRMAQYLLKFLERKAGLTAEQVINKKWGRYVVDAFEQE